MEPSANELQGGRSLGVVALAVAVVGPLMVPGIFGSVESHLGLATAIVAISAIPMSTLILAYSANRLRRRSPYTTEGRGVILAAIVIGWIEAALAVPIIFAMIWLHDCAETACLFV